MQLKFTKIEGTKVFARMTAEDGWTHIETIPDYDQAFAFCEGLEDRPKDREEYIAEPLS